MSKAASAMLLFFFAGIGSATASAGETYQYFVAGDPADVSPPVSGLIVLQGGGDWVEDNFRAMSARGGHGDFVVLSASGGDYYSEELYALCQCNSVESIDFGDRAASYDEKVIRVIRDAEALFIGGGDQSRYVRFWQGTPVQDAINQLAARSVPIGGTSAGMAVLGEFVYSAMGEESLTSDGALADPYDENLTLARDFLSLPRMADTITDQHLEERDRIGRTVALMARVVQAGWADEVRAIAADRETALHVDPGTGIGTVHATAVHATPYVYFLRMTGLPVLPAPGVALTTGAVEVHRAGPGDTFDLGAWRGRGGETYSLKSVEGRLQSSAGSAYGSRKPRESRVSD